MIPQLKTVIPSFCEPTETESFYCRVVTDKTGLNLDYLPHLRRALTEPLIREGQEGVSRVVTLLDDYDLMREDFETTIEVTQWPHMKDPMKDLIESKVCSSCLRLSHPRQVTHLPHVLNWGVLLYGLFIRTAVSLVWYGIFWLNCRLVFGAKMTDASSKIDVRKLIVGGLLIKIWLHCALIGLVFLFLGRSWSESQ